MSGDLWSQILAALELQMTRVMFNTLLSGARGAIEDDVLYIQLINEMTVEWVGGRLLPVIERTAERVAGRRLMVELGTRTLPASRGPPLQNAPPGSEQAPPAGGSGVVPDDLGVSIELVRLNPERYGFVKLSNYAVRFWQPYLGAQPFALWVALRSFAYNAQREVWPSIQTLADICAGGNRHVLLGRAAWTGRAVRR